MEFGEFEAVDGRIIRVRCSSCGKWVRLDEPVERGKAELSKRPCPHCDETGEELRKKEDDLKRAFESRKADRKP